MSTSRSGIELFLETYFSYSPWIKDSALVPLPWRPVTLPPKLKIAIMWSDDIVTPHPPITRALKEVSEILKRYPDRFELVEWKAWEHDTCWDITHALYFEDGGRAIRKEIEDAGETLLPLTEWLLKDGDNIKYRTVEEIWDVSAIPLVTSLYISRDLFLSFPNLIINPQLKLRRNAYRDHYNTLWLSTGIDAILCPTGPGPAPPLGNAKYWSYTSQWNMLEYAAAVFPATVVDVEHDVKDPAYVPMNEKDRFNWDLYEPVLYKDAPVGLQVVTRRWEDEKCMAVLKEIELAMGRK